MSPEDFAGGEAVEGLRRDREPETPMAVLYYSIKRELRVAQVACMTGFQNLK